jgi:hypothetical protein
LQGGADSAAPQRLKECRTRRELVHSMSEDFSITVNGRQVRASTGCSVAAAIFMAGEPCRFSVSGEPRGPLCGMGICMECRATVNGVPQRRTCQMTCAAGMEVVTG